MQQGQRKPTNTHRSALESTTTTTLKKQKRTTTPAPTPEGARSREKGHSGAANIRD